VARYRIVPLSVAYARETVFSSFGGSEIRQLRKHKQLFLLSYSLRDSIGRICIRFFEKVVFFTVLTRR
jgi:hypothetical protein